MILTEHSEVKHPDFHRTSNYPGIRIAGILIRIKQEVPASLKFAFRKSHPPYPQNTRHVATTRTHRQHPLQLFSQQKNLVDFLLIYSKMPTLTFGGHSLVKKVCLVHG